MADGSRERKWDSLLARDVVAYEMRSLELAEGCGIELTKDSNGKNGAEED